MNNLFFNISNAAGLVPCGGYGEVACTSCHIFLMIQNLLRYVMQIAVVFVVISLVVLGLRYMVDAKGGKVILMKKIKGLLTGVILVMCSWLIINTVIVMVSPADGMFDNWYVIDCKGGLMDRK